MFVQNHMTAPAITVKADIPFLDALQVMQEHHFRRLPVVDEAGKLIGIVAERDLLYASPSPATSLSVWEQTYLLSKIKVRKLMTEEVITTTPDTTIEDAAHLMVVKRVGGLPVVDKENRPVGMITETDIFKTLVQMFGGGKSGVRLTLGVPHGKGILARLAQAIHEMDGYIISFGSFPIREKPEEDGIVMKVRETNREQLVQAVEALGDHVLDVREVEESES